MATTPIDSVVVQALLRSVGLVEVEKEDKPEEGLWQIQWFGGPLPRTKDALQSNAGRKGLHRALAGNEQPRVRGLLPRDAQMHPESRPDKAPPLGLGTWLSFHDKVPVDLVLDPTPTALGLGIGVRAVKDGKPWFVVITRIAEVAVGDDKVPTSTKALARLRTPLELEGHLVLGEDKALPRLGLVAQFDPNQPKDFKAYLDVGDRRGRSTRVRFPQTEKGSFVAPPLVALLTLLRAVVVSKVLDVEADEKKTGVKQPNALFRRLEQHLFPLFEGGKDNPIPALSADVLGFDKSASVDALVAWLKGLVPKPGTTLLDLKLDAAAALVAHLRALFFGVPDEGAAPVGKGSWCAWVNDDKDFGAVLANAGVILDYDDTELASNQDVLTLGLGARARKKRVVPTDPDVSLDLSVALLQVKGQTLVTTPTVRAAFSVRAPEGSPGPGGLTRIEVGFQYAGSLAPYVAVFLGEKKRLLLDRPADRAVLVSTLQALGQQAASGLWQQVSSLVAEFLGASALATLTEIAAVGPAKFLEDKVLGEVRKLLGQVATGDLALALPLGATLGLSATGLALTLPPTLPFTGSAALTASGASLSLGLDVAGPAELPFDASLSFGLDTNGGSSVGVKLRKSGIPDTLLPLLGAAPLPTFAGVVGLLWPEVKKLLPSDGLTLLTQVGLVDASGNLALSADGKAFAAAGWGLLVGLAKEGLPDKITGEGGKPELSLTRTDTDLGLTLTKLDAAGDGLSASVSSLTLGVAKKGPGGWALAPSLGGAVRVEAAGTGDEPLLANDFLYLDRAAVTAEMTLIGINAAGNFVPPSLASAMISVRDLRLPFGGSKDEKKSTSVESGLLAKDGKNPGISLDVAWKAPGQMTLAFPAGAPAAPKLPEGDVVAIEIPIQRQIGPLDVASITVGLGATSTDKPESASVHVVLGASFELGGVHIQPEGLGVRIPFATLTSPETWSVTLSGLGLSFKNGGITLAGRFARVGTGFEGDALVSAFGFSLGAIGAYSQIPTPSGGTQPSLYVFAVCRTPLGGPPFFFVTGVAGGFGVNRLLDRSADPKSIRNHPLLALMTGNVDKGREYLSLLKPQPGAYWLAGGVNFLSFGLIRGSALLYVLFDRGFELGVMAVASVGMDGLAQVNIGIDAGLTTRGETTLWARGALFDSWLVFPDCQLTGGFALQVWPDAGEAVLSIGGYGPLYKKPARYPDVELLGLRWQSDALVAKGGVYFAMTPREAMAGVEIEVMGKWGPLSAGFNAEVHGLLGWDPFHFEVRASVAVWGAFGGMRFEVGVGLHLYGPPVGGRATVKLLVVSIEIPFGEDKVEFPERISVPKLLRSQLSLTPASESATRVVLPQETIWGASGSEKPSSFALAVAAGGAGDQKKALPTQPSEPVLTTAEPVLVLSSRLPFDRVTGMNSPVLVAAADPLHLGPAGRRVNAATLDVAMPKAIRYGAIVLAERELRYETPLGAAPKALFGPSDAHAQGTSATTSADTMAELHDTLRVDARAVETPAFPDLARDVELSDGDQVLDLPLAFGWASAPRLVAAEKAYQAVHGGTTTSAADAVIHRPGSKRAPKAELVAARWAPALAEPLAYRPLANRVLLAESRKALSRVRTKSPVPQVIGVAIRPMDRTLRGAAFVATRVTGADSVPRVAPPQVARRSAVLATVTLRRSAPPSLALPALREPGRSSAADFDRRMAGFGPGAVLSPPTGGFRTEALTLGAVFGDEPLRVRLAAGEVAFFRLAAPGNLPAAPFALRLRGDQPVRVVGLDAAGTPLSDEELWPSEESLPLPAEAVRVAVFGLGRDLAWARHDPHRSPEAEEERALEGRGEAPVEAPAEGPLVRPSRADLGDLVRPITPRPNILRPVGRSTEGLLPRPVRPVLPLRPTELPRGGPAAPPAMAPAPRLVPRGVSLLRPRRPARPPVLPIVIRARLPITPTGPAMSGGVRPIFDAIHGRDKPAPVPPPPTPAPPPALPPSVVGFGPATELFALGRTTFLGPGCTVRAPDGVASRATELTTLRGADLTRAIESLAVTLPAGKGTLVLGVWLPEGDSPPVAEGLRLSVGDRRLPLSGALPADGFVLLLVPWAEADLATLDVRLRGGLRVRSLALVPLDLERAARLVGAHPTRELVGGDLLGFHGSVELTLEVRS